MFRISIFVLRISRQRLAIGFVSHFFFPHLLINSLLINAYIGFVLQINLFDGITGSTGLYFRHIM